MKKFLGITLGGLQRKAIILVLTMLLIVIAASAGVSARVMACRTLMQID